MGLDDTIYTFIFGVTKFCVDRKKATALNLALHAIEIPLSWVKQLQDKAAKFISLSHEPRIYLDGNFNVYSSHETSSWNKSLINIQFI